MTDRIVRSRYFIRTGEMLVPAIAWIVILMPLWLSPFHPAVVAYFIIGFDLYFLYKSLTTAYFSSLSYALISSFRRVDFAALLRTIPDHASVQHFIIIPNYQEPIYKLKDTVRAIVKNGFSKKQMHLVLAFEKREAEAPEKAQEIIREFGHAFNEILSTYHVLQPHEAPGKASNQTHAAQEVETYVRRKGYDEKKTLITICDADSILPSNYFSYLTFEFLRDAERLFHFYWAPVLLYNNFWQLPFFVRMQATLSSILRLAFLSQKKSLIHISTYATNLWLLRSINYWDVDIIPEDWHVYYQAFFTFGERVRTIPLYTIVNGDAVYSGSIFKTFSNRYEQEKRWAWGVTDISYFWNNMFTARHIRPHIKAQKFLQLVETHLLWPTSFFILTIGGWIPPLVNETFGRTVLGFILPQLTGIILTLATAMLFLYLYLDIKLRHRLKQKTPLMQIPLFFIQWYLLPLVSFILSALPALDAHTRLLFGKKIEYKVTEKV